MGRYLVFSMIDTIGRVARWNENQDLGVFENRHGHNTASLHYGQATADCSVTLGGLRQRGVFIGTASKPRLFSSMTNSSI